MSRAQWQTERRSKARLSRKSTELTAADSTVASMTLNSDNSNHHSFMASDEIEEAPGAFAMRRQGVNGSDHLSLNWEMGSNNRNGGSSENDENNLPPTRHAACPLHNSRRRITRRSSGGLLQEVPHQSNRTFHRSLITATCSFDDTFQHDSTEPTFFDFDIVIQERQRAASKSRCLCNLVGVLISFASFFMVGLIIFRTSSDYNGDSPLQQQQQQEEGITMLECNNDTALADLINFASTTFPTREQSLYLLQCPCGYVDTSTITPQMFQRYNNLKLRLKPPPDELWRPVDSCISSNLSLLWLAWVHDNLDNFTSIQNQYVLVQLFIDWKGSDWRKSTNWLQNKDECTWYGVNCFKDGDMMDNIQNLSMKQNDLCGEIKSFPLSLLPNLQQLVLSSNSLNGTLPVLPNAHLIDLNANQMAGNIIPSAIGQMSRLRKLFLSRNKLSGSLPTVLSELTNLEELNVEENIDLEGNFSQLTLPLKNLSHISIKTTGVGGPLTFLEKLTNLRYVDLSFSSLSGTFPRNIGKTMEDFRAGQLKLFGTIPSSIGYLTKCSRLEVRGTQVSGTIPTEIGHATNLVYFNVGNSRLEGTIPSELGRLQKLEILFLHTNNLERAVPSELGLLTKLKILEINGNHITGTLPTGLCQVTVLRDCKVACGCCQDRCCPSIAASENECFV